MGINHFPIDDTRRIHFKLHLTSHKLTCRQLFYIAMISTVFTDEILEVTLSVDALDASNATEVKTALQGLSLEGRERVVVDISQVNFIDSSGIGALLFFYKQVDQKLTLRRPTPTVLSVLELLRLHRILEIEPESAWMISMP